MPTAQPGFLRRREAVEVVPPSQRAARGVDFHLLSRVVGVPLCDRFLAALRSLSADPGRNTGCAEFDALGRELLDYSFEIACGHAE